MTIKIIKYDYYFNHEKQYKSLIYIEFNILKLYQRTNFLISFSR